MCCMLCVCVCQRERGGLGTCATVCLWRPGDDFVELSSGCQSWLAPDSYGSSFFSVAGYYELTTCNEAPEQVVSAFLSVAAL